MDAPFGPIVTAAVTPFNPDGSIALPAFRALLRHLAATGSTAVVVAGTTGESPTLTDDEKIELWAAAVDEVGGQIAVIAGSGSNGTHHSELLTRRAVELGVDGILAVTPYYNNPPREGLYQHFRAVAAAAGTTPVILYNVPGRTVVNLEPQLVAQLAQIDNVVAIKQANPDLVETGEIATLAPGVAIYAGNDDSLLPMLGLGAVGGILVSSHLIGAEMSRIVELWQEGDEAAAAALDAELRDVYETMGITTNPIPVKTAVELMGFEVGPLRLPMVAASGMQRERIRAMLERHDLLKGAVGTSVR